MTRVALRGKFNHFFRKRVAIDSSFEIEQLYFCLSLKDSWGVFLSEQTLDIQ